MQTAPEKGPENKDQKGPADPGTKPPVVPQAPTIEEVAKALNDTDLALAKAEGEIVRLKGEAKKKGDPNANDTQIEELNKTIADLRTDIETLKKGTVTRDEADELVTEIAGVRKRNKELGEALISKNTTGAGTGQGANQDQQKPPEKKEELSPADEAVMARVRQRRISQGRDPETGLPIKK